MRHRIKSSLFGDEILSTLYKEREKHDQKVCFLSGQERKFTTGGEITNVGPDTYDIDKYTSAISQILRKVASNAGYGGLASKTPRFSCTPKETRRPTVLRSSKISKETRVIKIVRKSAKPPPPFGSNIPRNFGSKRTEDVPDFHYDISKAFSKREIDFDHCFGGRTRLRPKVLWKCTPENTDVCCKCGKKPQGDYYISGSTVLCRNCFDLEWNKPMKFSREQMDAFKTIRDCSGIHDHGGTTAAVALVSNREIRKQRVLEGYFASFASPRKVVRIGHRVTESKCQFAKSSNKLTVLYEGKDKKDFTKED